MALEHGMIEPFVDEQVRAGRRLVRRVVVRLRRPRRRRVQGVHQRLQHGRRSEELRPEVVRRHQGGRLHHPAELVRARQHDRVLPRSRATCSRSASASRTYARCGIIVNVTPFEPEWEGHVTIEISNTTPLPAKIYANEGIAQVLFFQSDEPCAGLVQGQEGQVPGAARRDAAEDLRSDGSNGSSDPVTQTKTSMLRPFKSAYRVRRRVRAGHRRRRHRRREQRLDERGDSRRREPHPHRQAAPTSRT